MFDMFLNSTIQYTAPVVTVADDGTNTIADATPASTLNIPASVHELSSTENIKYGRELSAILAKVYVPLTRPDGTSLTLEHWGRVLWQGNYWRILGYTIVDVNLQGFQKFVIERDV